MAELAFLPFDPLGQTDAGHAGGHVAPRRAEHNSAAGICWRSSRALLVLRAVIYWWIGSAAHWTGKLDLGVVSLSFRSDWFGRMLLFSFFSFGLTLGIFYLWLLLLSLLAGGRTPIHRLVRMPLGRVDGWPRWAKIIAAVRRHGAVLVAGELAAGLAANHAQPVSAAHRLEQSLVIGLGSYLALEISAGALLVLHLLNTYIYFGKHPFWKYVNATAQTLLPPLEKIPLRPARWILRRWWRWRYCFSRRNWRRAAWSGFTRGCRFETRQLRFRPWAA